VGTGVAAKAAGLADASGLITLSCLALIGVVVTAAYFLWLTQRVLLGPLKESILEKAHGHLSDMNRAEWLSLLPLAVFTVLIGIIPGPIVLNVINDFDQWLLTSLSALLGGVR
jgi:NADH:ubiquinone oxidoreductase subunit 4 (subunit M)